MNKRLRPDPYLADIQEWPCTLEGTVDIVDGGWTVGLDPLEGDSKADILRSFTAVAHLQLPDGNKVGFLIDGAVLVPLMIWPEEFDAGNLFRVRLEPIDGDGTPMAVDGKLIYLQEYQALQIERVE